MTVHGSCNPKCIVRRQLFFPPCVQEQIWCPEFGFQGLLESRREETGLFLALSLGLRGWGQRDKGGGW